VWRAVTYFSLWAVRLSGWLPELQVCLDCGGVLENRTGLYFSRGDAGLVCSGCRRGGSWELSVESRGIAGEMSADAVAQLSARNWEQSTGADLRRFSGAADGEHADRRLVTVRMLEEA
jgi:DNA repair protein RecO (recombination protein O)